MRGVNRLLSLGRAATLRPGQAEEREGHAVLAGIVSAVVTQVGLAVSGIIAARSLGPVDRGQLALVTLLPLILTQLGSLGLPLSVTYVVARGGSLPSPVSRFAWRTCVTQSILVVVVCGAVMFPLIWDRGSDTRVAAAAALAVVPVQLIAAYALAVLQGARRVIAFYTLTAMITAGWVIGLVAFLVIGDLTLVTASLTYTASVIVTAVAAVLVMRRAVKPQAPAPGEWIPTRRWMLSFGARGLLGWSPIVSAYRLDQAIVGLFLAPAALGRYVVAVSFTNLPRFISTSIGAMAYPTVASRHDPGAIRSAIVRYLTASLAACAVIVVPCFVFASPLVTTLFGDSFASAASVLRILLISSVLVAAQRVLIDCARGLNRPTIGSVSEVALLATLIPLAALLVPLAGVKGMAWAVVAAAFVGLAIAVRGVIGGPREIEPEAQPETEGGVDPFAFEATIDDRP
jgi:O-antigen/teichoic acid export membrane protein